MNLNLRGKNVLITGSTKGIGLGIARAFHDEGANLILNSRSSNLPFSLESEFSGTSCFHCPADVGTKEGNEKLALAVKDHFGGNLDILICNVGSGSSVPPGNETEDEWKKSFSINFFSATNVIENLLQFMPANFSAITCISSICGHEALGAPLTYSVAKAALNSYVVGFSRVLGKKGIRINAVSPGNILFENSVWDRKLKSHPKEVQTMLDQDVALKTLGTVEDVANMTLFLSSEKAKFITGSIHVVDGGQLRSW